MTPDESTLASEPLDTLDEQVLLTVRNMHARLDPVPSGLTDRIKFELTLAALHAEIAELQRVSLAGVRADDTAYAPTQSVTFTSSRLSLMVTLTPDRSSGAATSHSGPMVRIDGWVTAGGATVELFVGGRTFTRPVR
jgi:outer membrane protein TolC